MFSSNQEIETFISDFESCHLPKSDWTHNAHLVVGAWYLSKHSFDEALTIVRQRISTYNSSTGTANTDSTGYHETLTHFYLSKIAEHNAYYANESFIVSLSLLLQSPISNREYALSFYSRDKLFSVQARKHWIEPNL